MPTFLVAGRWGAVAGSCMRWCRLFLVCSVSIRDNIWSLWTLGLPRLIRLFGLLNLFRLLNLFVVMSVTERD